MITDVFPENVLSPWGGKGSLAARQLRVGLFAQLE